MSIAFRTGIVVFAATVVTGLAIGARTGFSGDVCGLLTAKQVTSIPGMTSKCKKQPQTEGPLGSTDYEAIWSGAPTESFQVTVEVYGDKEALKRAKQNLNQGLLGTAKPLKGVGDLAYESKAAMGVDINVAVGKDIAIIVLTDIRKPPSSPAEIVPVTKAIVAVLKSV
jgi:hypothetical protein